MKIGLFYTRIRKDEKYLIEQIRSRGWSLDLLNDHKIMLSGESCNFDLDVLLERGIHHHRALESLAVFERFGILTVNSWQTAEICGNKILVTDALVEAGLRVPQSFVSFTVEETLKMISKVDFPVVLKPAIGSWGTLLAKINDLDSLEGILTHKKKLGSYHHSVFYIQEFVENVEADIRVFVVGGQVVGAVRACSDHWLGMSDESATFERWELDKDLEHLCVQAALAVKGEVVAVDVLINKEGYWFIEVEYTVELFKYSQALDCKKIVEMILDRCQDLCQRT